MENKPNRYTSGEYLAVTGGTWHMEDSPHKAAAAWNMLERLNPKPATICEVGCGAGGVLAGLSEKLPGTRFVGYDISPQAHELSSRTWAGRKNISFVLGDAFEVDATVYDVAMFIDVVEHVEDCFAFLRKAKNKGVYKLYQIPLEISCLAALRDGAMLHAWKTVGHLHRFSALTALEAVKYTGQEVVDYCLNSSALCRPNKRFRTRAANMLRRLVSPSLAARLFGGFTIVILAR